MYRISIYGALLLLLPLSASAQGRPQAGAVGTYLILDDSRATFRLRLTYELYARSSDPPEVDVRGSFPMPRVGTVLGSRTYSWTTLASSLEFETPRMAKKVRRDTLPRLDQSSDGTMVRITIPGSERGRDSVWRFDVIVDQIVETVHDTLVSEIIKPTDAARQFYLQSPDHSQIHGSVMKLAADDWRLSGYSGREFLHRLTVRLLDIPPTVTARPTSAMEVWSRQGGDCSDRVHAICGVLRHSGFAARGVVCVPTNDFGGRRPPISKRTLHAIGEMWDECGWGVFEPDFSSNFTVEVVRLAASRDLIEIMQTGTIRLLGWQVEHLRPKQGGLRVGSPTPEHTVQPRPEAGFKLYERRYVRLGCES